MSDGGGSKGVGAAAAGVVAWLVLSGGKGKATTSEPVVTLPRMRIPIPTAPFTTSTIPATTTTPPVPTSSVDELVRQAVADFFAESPLADREGIVDTTVAPVVEVAAPATVDTTPETTAPVVVTYIVEAGDGLQRICNLFGCNWVQLAALNGLDPDSHEIHPGQVLVIPS